MLKNKFMNFLILAFVIINCANCDQFWIGRDLKCINASSTKCVKWNETTYLSYYSSYSYFYCFPSDTYVLTSDGPKSMLDLTVGD
jgi:hypothetical protein